MNKAVLFLIFNRPDYTKTVFEAIKMAKPPRLYIASDGPRDSVAGEKELVENLRKDIVKSIDWDCEVKTLFQNKNLRCGPAIFEALNWFFEQEESGIILEDDCLPDQSFYHFCDELLDKYKDNKDVWLISGNQFDSKLKSKDSYIFTRLTCGWGWASWADRWKYYSYDLEGWSDDFIFEFSKDKNVQDYFLAQYHWKKQKLGGWAFQFMLMVMKYKGLCIHPAKNLVTNIGINGEGYHNAIEDPNLNVPTHEIDKIIHPKKIKCDKKYEEYFLRKVFNIPKYKGYKWFGKIKHGGKTKYFFFGLPVASKKRTEARVTVRILGIRISKRNYEGNLIEYLKKKFYSSKSTIKRFKRYVFDYEKVIAEKDNNIALLQEELSKKK